VVRGLARHAPGPLIFYRGHVVQQLPRARSPLHGVGTSVAQPQGLARKGSLIEEGTYAVGAMGWFRTDLYRIVHLTYRTCVLRPGDGGAIS
jgi:hypothetical protein